MEDLTDSRKRPRIKTAQVGISIFWMHLCRLGSLNALDMTRENPFWKRVLSGAMPSPDSLGRIAAHMHPGEIREIHASVYGTLRRKKALPPLPSGFIGLLLDAHESTASYRSRCSGCLERRVKVGDGESIQYYHRYVAATLVGQGYDIFLDLEAIKPREDEVTAARRLLRRVHQRMPRSYDVVLVDGLYVQGPFFNDVLDLGKDVLSVLKKEDMLIFQDAMGLFEEQKPVRFRDGSTIREAWDIEGFTSLDSVDQPLRVLRCIETTSIRRQRTKEVEQVVRTWMWVTTLTRTKAPTRVVINLGHTRWRIENNGFNLGVNYWHMDHVYRHHPQAMDVILLLAMLAFNVFHVFYQRNLKPALRLRTSLQHIARIITGELYSALQPRAAPT